MSGWEEPPADLINAICKRLESYVDHVRLRGVCASWNVAIPKRPTHLLKQIPWLMLPFDDETQTRRSFYSISDHKVYHWDLSETRGKGKWIRGSSHGWLVIVESPALCLFNPLTKVQIALPPIYTFPDIGWHSSYDTGREYAIIDCFTGETFYISTGAKLNCKKHTLRSLFYPPPHVMNIWLRQSTVSSDNWPSTVATMRNGQQQNSILSISFKMSYSMKTRFMLWMVMAMF
ncbi:hypothetical protein SLE2022_359200 [Rubroshorea leprosula]